MQREQPLPEGMAWLAGDASGEFINGRDARLRFCGKFGAREARSDEV